VGRDTGEQKTHIGGFREHHGALFSNYSKTPSGMCVSPSARHHANISTQACRVMGGVDRPRAVCCFDHNQRMRERGDEAVSRKEPFGPNSHSTRRFRKHHSTFGNMGH
jgi:hypothetical protein